MENSVQISHPRVWSAWFRLHLTKISKTLENIVKPFVLRGLNALTSPYFFLSIPLNAEPAAFFANRTTKAHTFYLSVPSRRGESFMMLSFSCWLVGWREDFGFGIGVVGTLVGARRWEECCCVWDPFGCLLFLPTIGRQGNIRLWPADASFMLGCGRKMHWLGACDLETMDRSKGH